MAFYRLDNPNGNTTNICHNDNKGWGVRSLKNTLYLPYSFMVIFPALFKTNIA